MYERKTDKSLIPTCTIMGVNIAAVSKKQLLDFTVKNLKDLSGDYLCVANVHTTVTAYDNPEYRKVQNGGIMAIPDGGPLSAVGRKRGFQEMQRTTGPGYMKEIMKISSEYGFSHYFYGSTEETLEKMVEKLKSEYPDLKIAGTCSPPFRALTEDEEKKIIDEITELSPDFVWVGLGAPKQEYWMAKHQGKIPGFMVGVGAAFDYIAGNIQRAPEWMQKRSLEWLYRLMQEPKRLFKRYLYTNTKFIWNVYIRGK